jgi:uracil-DNA glycosylase family 4
MTEGLARLSKDGKLKPLMGTGTKKAKIMIVQENPYSNEYRKQVYMDGKAGRMLKAGLSEVGINLDDVYFTGLVKFPTPEDRLPLDDEVKDSMDLMWAEIDVIQPDIIVPTGNLSLKALTKQTAITKKRGKLIETEEYKFFPIIGPQMVLKQPKYLDLFSKDLINLAAVLEGKTPAGAKEFTKDRKYFDTDYREAVEEIKRLMSLPKGSKIVVDLETTKADPFVPKVTMGKTNRLKYPESERTKICCIGFSDRSGYGCAIPLYHRETPYNGNEIGTIVKFLRWLFSNEDLVFSAHNSKFELKWLRRQLDITCETMAWDSMLMHYLAITEEGSTHGLKDLAWTETDMGGYDDALDKVKPKGQDEGNYDLIPWDILKVYLADDCDAEYRLLEKWEPVIRGDKRLNWLWENIMRPGYYTLLDIESNGVHVDLEWLKTLEKAYGEELHRIQDKLHQYPEVLEIERENMDKWVERCQIGQIKKANRTDEQQRKFEVYKRFDPSKGGIKFNFGSPTQLGELLFNRLGLETIVYTDTGNFSTNDESLIYMQGQHPIIDTLKEFKKVNHLNNSFVTGLRVFLDTDGFIHPNYNLHGTVTGRLSSSDPNAQQLPRKSNNIFSFQYYHEIKTLFTSRFGNDGYIMQFDYSQLELRILAVFSQDEKLIELYRSGADLHKAVASDAFSIDIEEVNKDQRTASKKIQLVA